MRFAIVALLAALTPCAALAQPAGFSDCSGSIGGTAANITFPAAGKTGPPQPHSYLAIQNNSTSNQVIWFNATGAAAVTAAPSWQLTPTAGFTWSQGDGIPSTVSVIASASGAALTCFYR